MADPRLIAAMIEAESSGRADARSRKGALGLMQVMPETAEYLGYDPKDMLDPDINVEAGSKYIRQLIDRYDDHELALMAYNWGPGNVDKYLAGEKRTIPQETQKYVKKIKDKLGAGAKELFTGPTRRSIPKPVRKPPPPQTPSTPLSLQIAYGTDDYSPEEFTMTEPTKPYVHDMESPQEPWYVNPPEWLAAPLTALFGDEIVPRRFSDVTKRAEEGLRHPPEAVRAPLTALTGGRIPAELGGRTSPAPSVAPEADKPVGPREAAAKVATAETKVAETKDDKSWWEKTKNSPEFYSAITEFGLALAGSNKGDLMKDLTHAANVTNKSMKVMRSEKKKLALKEREIAANEVKASSAMLAALASGTGKNATHWAKMVENATKLANEQLSLNTMGQTDVNKWVIAKASELYEATPPTAPGTISPDRAAAEAAKPSMTISAEQMGKTFTNP